MTAICQICGVTVEASSGPMLLNPGTDVAAAQAVAEISTFDLLAGRVSQHMERHQAQTLEMIAVMHLAGKVYAMTWAESPGNEPEYSALRDAWRTGILTMLQSTTKPVAVFDSGQATAAEADEAGAVS